MSEDRVARMQQLMEELQGMQQRVGKLITEELQGWMNDLMKGMLDPSKIMSFIQSMGIDVSQLPGMMSQQPGFDPYQVLGLDKSASEEEVKEAYRKVMSKVHPDKAGPELTFMATIANAAYEFIRRERGWQ